MHPKLHPIPRDRNSTFTRGTCHNDKCAFRRSCFQESGVTQEEPLDPPTPSPKKTARSNARIFDQALRVLIVARLLQPGTNTSKFAREIGVSHWTLREWKTKHSEEAKQLFPNHAELIQDRDHLRREYVKAAIACAGFTTLVGEFARIAKTISIEEVESEQR